MANEKEKTQPEKIEEALFIRWRKREKFMIFCKQQGFSLPDLLLLSGQYFSFMSN